MHENTAITGQFLATPKRNLIMQLTNLIFHELITQQHSSTVEVIPREDVLPLPNDKADRLVIQARQSYNKDSGVAYADFGHGWFPDCLSQLINDEIDFVSFSESGLSDLEGRISREPLTTGGHLFFIQYEEDNTRYMMTLLLKDIDGFVIDDQNISEGHILNLEKLHFAARINIDRWLNQETGYISFLKGSKRKEVSDYFKGFLCINEDSFNDPKRNTDLLVEAIKEYCNENIQNDTEKSEIRNRITDEIRRRVENQESVTVTAVAALISPEEPERFTSFVNASAYDIQAEFRADLNAIRKLTRYAGRTKDINISFEAEAMEEGRVKFTETTKDGVVTSTLTIFDIPDKLLEELRNNTGSSNNVN